MTAYLDARRWLCGALVFTACLALLLTPSPASRPQVPARVPTGALKSLSLAPPARQVGPARLAPGRTRISAAVTAYSSYNWSGYVNQNSGAVPFQMVKGSWIQPAVTCTQEDQWAVFWVGLDGWTTGTVEQAGSYAWCYRGVAYYDTWWEMYPTNDITAVAAINPGDHLTASVIYANGKYTLKVVDATTTTGSFSTVQTCGSGQVCSNSSAEWIAERPGGATGYFPLPNFKKWSLTRAAAASGATKGVITTFPADQVGMIDTTGAYNLATPGALNATGNAFGDAWNDSY